MERHQRRVTEPFKANRQISPRRRAITDAGSWPELDARSKSETTMPTFSSLHKVRSSSSELAMRLPSRDKNTSPHPNWLGDRQESFAKTLLTKSSKMLLKRKSSKLSMVSVRTMEWLEDKEDGVNSKDVQELSKRRRSKHSRAQTAGYGEYYAGILVTTHAYGGKETMLKQSISEPYNFQHLTHTGSQQVKDLKTVSQNELVTEFSAIRASQAPRRELKGIKAEDLIPKNFYIETRSPALSIFDSPTTSVPQSPTKSRDQWSEASTINDNSSIRNSRSVDSFTRVSSRSFSSPTPPISPPPRTSSRMALQRHVPSRLFSPESPIAPTFTSSMIDGLPLVDRTSPPLSPSSMNGFDISTDHPNLGTIAQAVTTPDDTACPLGQYQLGSPAALADVPEEEEGFPWTRRPTRKHRPSTSSSALRHAKSFPVTESPTKLSTPSVYNLMPSQSLSFGNGSTASDPTLPFLNREAEDVPLRPRSSRKLSIVSKGIDENWEDDIDYCYEHAAEADCAFEWDRSSAHGDEDVNSSAGPDSRPINSNKHGHTLSSSGLLNTSKSTRSIALHPRLDCSLVNDIPNDIFAGSGTSSAVTMPGIITPVDAAQSPLPLALPRTSSGTPLFPLTPSLLIPNEYTSRLIHEETFQQTLTDAEAIKLPHPYYRPPIDTDVRRDYSPRSSGSPLSKCNSRESMLASRPNSLDPRHRNSSSVGSLPELIHSKNSREKFVLAADQLANQISSLHVAGNPAELSAMIDVARQDLVRNATSTESIAEESEEVAAGTRTPASVRRQRSNSDSAGKLLNNLASKSSAGNLAGRTRSSSAATSFSGKSKSGRSSYSLFPTTTSK